jgi:selenocysteine lyase/cysteine desulfurase
VGREVAAPPLAALSAVAAAVFATGWRPGWVDRLDRVLAPIPSSDAQTIAQDEGFWHDVRQSFTLEPGLINLNYGYSPMPNTVLDRLERETERTNRAAQYWGHWPKNGTDARREEVRQHAATLLNCNTEELALTRSTTESLQIVQLGLDLRRDDEVLSTSEDYWAMWNTWQQRVRRDGIKYTEIVLASPYPAPGEIVARFERAVTPRTRAILLSHLTGLTGHIMPVREICHMAAKRDVRTIIDGAQAPGHIPVDLRTLGCDYYGTSGHKWLMAPLGTGLLYVRRDLIRELWPLTPAWEHVRDDIRKFEWVGGQSLALHLAMADALVFHERLGTQKKSVRLHYLKRRWAERFGRHPRIRILTDISAGRSCGLCSFAIDGIDSAALAEYLLQKHRILVFAFGKNQYEGIPGIRVAPNVFTSAGEIDRFSDAVETVLREGLS